VDLPLVDEEVSRTHAWVTLTRGPAGTEVMLEDQDSTNGTFLNDQAIHGPVLLSPGDRISLGNHVLKLVAMDPLERSFYAVLLDQSTRDPLTGLNNRRSTLEELQSRFELSKRHNRALAVIMCDLDFFKQINDTLGHGAGDQVLQEFGLRVKNGLRTSDMAGRIGGEEFLLVLPETDLEGAMLLAERLRAATGGVPFDLASNNSIQVTCSLGVAQRGADDRDGGALLARADGALYTAKRAGRNQVVAARP
jgi:diguanylate cyclase (GGDEF)-like protein